RDAAHSEGLLHQMGKQRQLAQRWRQLNDNGGANARAEGRYQNVMPKGATKHQAARADGGKAGQIGRGLRAFARPAYRPLVGIPLEGLLSGGRMLGMVTILDNRPLRHPEKVGKPDAPLLRKPEWIRVRMPTASAAFAATQRIVREHGLHTVCEEAACPNIG